VIYLKKKKKNFFFFFFCFLYFISFMNLQRILTITIGVIIIVVSIFKFFNKHYSTIKGLWIYIPIGHISWMFFR